MKINTDYISINNSYEKQIPLYIVIHNTDNISVGADAKAHAMAQHNGNFDGMSAHVYVDDKTAYQALSYSRGAWHVGVNYGGRLFGVINNHNSIGIEMCMQAGYDYDRAFANTVEVCKQIMEELKIPANHVVQHYDVCAKNCPSAIRDRNHWIKFMDAIEGKTDVTDKQFYRIRKAWNDPQSQIGAYINFDNAKNAWKKGYIIFDWEGNPVYP